MPDPQAFDRLHALMRSASDRLIIGVAPLVLIFLANVLIEATAR